MFAIVTKSVTDGVVLVLAGVFSTRYLEDKNAVPLLPLQRAVITKYEIESNRFMCSFVHPSAIRFKLQHEYQVTL